MSIDHMHVPFGEMSIQVFCLFFHWILCSSGVKLHGLVKLIHLFVQVRVAHTVVAAQPLNSH